MKTLQCCPILWCEQVGSGSKALHLRLGWIRVAPLCVNKQVIDMFVAYLLGKEQLDFDDVARVVAAYRVCEGFTAKELHKAGPKMTNK